MEVVGKISSFLSQILLKRSEKEGIPNNTNMGYEIPLLLEWYGKIHIIPTFWVSKNT